MLLRLALEVTAYIVGLEVQPSGQEAEEAERCHEVEKCDRRELEPLRSQRDVDEAQAQSLANDGSHLQDDTKEVERDGAEGGGTDARRDDDNVGAQLRARLLEPKAERGEEHRNWRRGFEHLDERYTDEEVGSIAKTQAEREEQGDGHESREQITGGDV